MRILLSHRFFWPDSPPYAAMLRCLAEHFASQGHEVTVLSGQPSYRPQARLDQQPSRQQLNGVLVRRVRLLNETKKDHLVRGVNAVLYSLKLFIHILTARSYDIVTTSTFPPILAAFLACCACRIRGASFVYHCQDLHPEVSATLPGGRRGWLFGLLSALDSWTCRHSTRVVTLSEDMRKTLHERSSSAQLDIKIINNFELPVFGDGSASSERDRAHIEVPPTQAEGGEFELVFAGNLGRFQNLENVIRAMEKLPNLTDIGLTFVGDGSAKAALKAYAKETGDQRVRFLPYLTPERAKSLIARSDLGIVSLLAGMEKVAYPSKTMSYLGQGCPLLAIVDPDSELAGSINKDELGIVVDRPATPAAIAEAIRRAYEDREHWRAQRQRLREYTKHNFSESAILARWDALLSTI